MEQSLNEEDNEALLSNSAVEKLEKIANLSSINLKPTKRLEHDMSQPWPVAEESKM